MQGGEASEEEGRMRTQRAMGGGDPANGYVKMSMAPKTVQTEWEIHHLYEWGEKRRRVLQKEKTLSGIQTKLHIRYGGAKRTNALRTSKGSLRRSAAIAWERLQYKYTSKITDGSERSTRSG